jgi:hypothetical protein
MVLVELVRRRQPLKVSIDFVERLRVQLPPTRRPKYMCRLIIGIFRQDDLLLVYLLRQMPKLASAKLGGPVSKLCEARSQDPRRTDFAGLNLGQWEFLFVYLLPVREYIGVIVSKWIIISIFICF